MNITAHIPIPQIREIQRTLDPVVFRRISASAINDAVRFGRTQISRGVREVINLKAKDLSKLITVEKATVSRQFGRITLSRQPSPMKIFAARQTAKGVSVKPRKQGPRELLRGAFIAQSLGGQVFRRAGKSRLPIEMQFGPTGAGVLAGMPGLLNRQTAIIQGKYVERMQSKIDAHLEGRAFGPLSEGATKAIAGRLSK